MSRRSAPPPDEPYRRIADRADAPMLLVARATGRVIHGNPAAQSLLRRRPLGGVFAGELPVAEDASAWAAALASGARVPGVEPALDARIRFPDGGSQPCRATFCPITTDADAILAITLAPTAASRPPSITMPAVRVGPPTALVADDNAVLANGVARVIREMGIEVLLAGDGRQAIELAESLGDLALAVVDVVMPGSDGITVYGQIRRVHPEAPVILCSGKGELAHLGGVELDGRTRFLPKPFTLPDLRDRIEEVLASTSSALSGSPETVQSPMRRRVSR